MIRERPCSSQPTKPGTMTTNTPPQCCNQCSRVKPHKTVLIQTTHCHCGYRFCITQSKKLQCTTRMVQLPATAAIEYVAACWVSGARGIFVRGFFCRAGLLPRGLFPRGSFGRGLLAGGFLSGGAFVRGVFCPGGLLSGGLMPVPPKFNAYTHRLGFLCLAS